MAGKTDFKIDWKTWNKQVSRLIQVTGKAADKVLKQSVQLAIKDCVKLTPPFKKGGGGKRAESYSKQKKIGLGAVERDIRRIFRTYFSTKGTGVRRQFGAAINKYLIENTATSLKKASDLMTTAGVPHEIVTGLNENDHIKARRKGRVPARRNRKHIYVAGGPVAEKALERYIKKRQKKVGYAKSGWGRAVNTFGVKGIPKWAKKLAPGVARKKKGSLMRGNFGSVYEFGNAIKNIQGEGLDLRIMQRAVGEQNRKLKIRLEKAIEKAPFWRH